MLARPILYCNLVDYRQLFLVVRLRAHSVEPETPCFLECCKKTGKHRDDTASFIVGIHQPSRSIIPFNMVDCHIVV
jgi:hypothetical protein